MKVDNNGLRLSVLLVLFQKIDSNGLILLHEYEVSYPV